MKGNIGEALVQYLLSDFCLVHKIDGSNDIGNDFICELIKEESPTNLLFYVQVKYTNRKPSIKKETLEYWKGSPIPVYLFWIKDDQPNRPSPNFSGGHFSQAQKMYKRYTPVLHNARKHVEEKFETFTRTDFLRDLIVDYMRTQYRQGFAPVVRPRDFLALDEKMEIGFYRYKLLVKDVIPEYSKEIIQNGWSNIFSLAISFEKSESLADKKQALLLLRIARDLIKRDENFSQHEEFVRSINDHIEHLSSFEEI